MTESVRAYAARLLDELKELDRTVTGAYYEMGRILASIRRDELYVPLGYESFSALIEEEMSFTAGTAHGYASVYEHFRRLKYTKKEAVEFIHNFGLRNMMRIMPDINDKIGPRAMKNRVAALDQSILSFWLHSAEIEEVREALIKMGAERKDTGRLMHTSEALLGMARKINGTKSVKAA